MSTALALKASMGDLRANARRRPSGPAIRQGHTPQLTQFYVYLTNGCNLACKHCWLAARFDPDGARAAMLPLDAFEAAIRQGKRLGLRTVVFTGGEPLLHPQFIRFVDCANRSGLEVNIETNGVLCTQALAAEIARCKRRFVSVSLDGADAATHEAIRGVVGSFDRSVRGVRALVRAGIRVQIIMSLLRSNIRQVDAFVRLAERLGASSVKFNVVQPTARGDRLQAQGALPSIPEIIDLGHRVDREMSLTSRLSLHFDYPAAFRPLSRIAQTSGCGTCNILGILGLLPTAAYALCGIGEHIPELVFGTVEHDALKDVWTRSPVLNRLREGLPRRLSGVCAHCLMRDGCLGSCIAQNYYRSGDFWSPFWFCAQADELGLFPASRVASGAMPSDTQVGLQKHRGKGTRT